MIQEKENDALFPFSSFFLLFPPFSTSKTGKDPLSDVVFDAAALAMDFAGAGSAQKRPRHCGGAVSGHNSAGNLHGPAASGEVPLDQRGVAAGHSVLHFSVYSVHRHVQLCLVPAV